MRRFVGAALAGAVCLAPALAAAAPAADGASGASTVAPVVVPPELKAPPAATITIPTDSNSVSGAFAVIWPAQALAAHISGRVVLTCEIDRYGLAEWCKVASEAPAKFGFGAAAMALRPTLKIQPAKGPDGPVDQVMNIAIEFTAPDLDIDWGAARAGGAGAANPTIFGGPALNGKGVSLLEGPIWTSTVGFDDVARAYPAKGGGADGYAVAHCNVKPDGSLAYCEAVKEAPENRGFGKAAVSLAARFRVAPEWSVAPHHADLWVDIPIRFTAPGKAADRSVANPYWVAGFDPDQELKVFPSEASAKGVTSGHGVAQCQVTAEGSLTDCKPYQADPEGLGFDTAAVTLASTMRMNPWTADGTPVDGDTVLVGMQLNLKGAGQAAAPPPARLSSSGATVNEAPAVAEAAAPLNVSLEGTWRGQATEESGERNLVLHIATRKGQLDASLDVPERRALDLTVLRFRRDGQQVTFFLPATGATYQGELSADGSTISGVWTNNRRTTTTDFVRDSSR